jgi:hypothetical protein
MWFSATLDSFLGGKIFCLTELEFYFASVNCWLELCFNIRLLTGDIYSPGAEFLDRHPDGFLPGSSLDVRTLPLWSLARESCFSKSVL